MHTHTEYSPDSNTTLEAQARAIRAADLDVVCATDHNTIEGGLRLRQLAGGFRVIIGEEIATRDGELVGLFLEQVVPAGLTAEETIFSIRTQGGVVSIPHPFSRSRPYRVRRDTLDRLWPLVDCIEVFNAREAFSEDNRRAEAYARERRIPGAVGSDAHRDSDLGQAWIEIDDFLTAEDFIEALRGGVVYGRFARQRSRLFAPYDALRNRLSRPRSRG